MAADIAEAEAANAEINQRLASAELVEIGLDPELQSYASSAGAAVFKTWCAQCHGSGAAGAKGYVSKPYEMRQVLEVVRAVLDDA